MKKILIVEDEPGMRDMIGMRLENAGHQVITAGDGREGLEKAQKENVDLIITDVLMPVMDGFAFYKELKKSKTLSLVPVIVLTARGKMEGTFLVIGADEFIVKPFNGEALLEKAERLLQRPKPYVQARTGTKVVVAGTDRETVENMVLQLKKAGCIPDLVKSGAEVISKVVMVLPAVLIMEVQLDGMEPPQIIDVLRKMPQAEKIPIVLYSYYRLSDLGSEDIRQRALSVDASEQACMKAGATEYLGRYNENTFMKGLAKYLK